MIVGIGSDVVNIERVARLHARFGERFLTRIFTEQEQSVLHNAEPPGSKPPGEGRRNQTVAARVAKRIAAKEAAAKALGTGFTQGVSWRDFEVSSDAAGRPALALRGMATQLMYRRMKRGERPGIHLSLSDDYPFALAFVVIEVGHAPR